MYEPVGSMTVTVSNKQNITISRCFCILLEKLFWQLITQSIQPIRNQIRNIYLKIGQYLNSVCLLQQWTLVRIYTSYLIWHNVAGEIDSLFNGFCLENLAVSSKPCLSQKLPVNKKLFIVTLDQCFPTSAVLEYG